MSESRLRFLRKELRYVRIISITMASSADVWAVTVNWNRGEDTLECIRSLEEAGVRKLIVVDNGSTDNSISLISEEAPWAIILEMKENAGYVRGMNAGLAWAMERGAEFILMMNNDAVATRGMVDTLLHCFREHPRAGIAGPMILYHNTSKVWFAGGHFNRIWGYTTHPMMDKDPPTCQESRKVDFISGCVMMVKAEVLREIGLLDPSYWMYMEDVDLCIRAERAGYECWYVPSAIAYHKVSSSSGRMGSNYMSPLRSYYYARNMLLLVHGMREERGSITRYLGQFLIRLPYYTFLICSQQAEGSLAAYLRGLKDAFVLILGGRKRS